MSEDEQRLERWSNFLEHFDVKVMRAPSSEVAQQFIASIPIDIAIADDSCVKTFGSLRRNQPNATCLHAARRSAERAEADFTLLAPIDLFVLEDVLERQLGLTRANEREDTEAKAAPVRERVASQ